MSTEQEPPGPADRLVELLARGMTAVGLNGTRLLWRWRQHKLKRAEAGLRGEIFWRSAKSKHKMCRSCRALVPRDASTCPDCGTRLGDDGMALAPNACTITLCRD